MDDHNQTPYPYPGSRDDGRTDNQIADLSRALRSFRVLVLIGGQDAGVVSLPTSINFEGLTEPVALGREAGEVLANSAELMRDLNGAIEQLRLQTDNEIRQRQDSDRELHMDGDRRIREAEARASAASGKAQQALNDERKRRHDAQAHAEAVCNGIEEALKTLETGRAATQESRCIGKLQQLAKTHSLLGYGGGGG